MRIFEMMTFIEVIRNSFLAFHKRFVEDYSIKMLSMKILYKILSSYLFCNEDFAFNLHGYHLNYPKIVYLNKSFYHIFPSLKKIFKFWVFYKENECRNPLASSETPHSAIKKEIPQNGLLNPKLKGSGLYGYVYSVYCVSLKKKVADCRKKDLSFSSVMR